MEHHYQKPLLIKGFLMNDAGSSVTDFSLEKVTEKELAVVKSVPWIFTTVFLPHQEPKDTLAWSRVDRDVELILIPSVEKSDSPKSLGKVEKQDWKHLWPFGIRPRQFLIWAASKVEEARRAEADLKANRLGASKRIEESRKYVHLEKHVLMIPNYSEFLKDVGVSKNSKNILSFRRQIKALAWSTIIIDSRNPAFIFNLDAKNAGDEGITASRQFTIAQDYVDTGSGIFMQFNEHVFEWLFGNNVPVVYSDALLLVKERKILAFDIYLWLSTRLHKRGAPFEIGWEELESQFGTEYDRVVDFRISFLDALERAKEVFRQYDGWTDDLVTIDVTINPVTGKKTISSGLKIIPIGFNVVDEAKRKGRVLLEGAPEFRAVPMRSVESPVSAPAPVPVPAPVRGSVSPVGVSDEVVESVLVFLRKHKPFFNALRVEGAELRLRRVVEKWVGQGFGFSDFEKVVNKKVLPDELIRCDGFIDSRMREFSVLRGDVVESEAKRKLGQLWCSVEEHRLSHSKVSACDFCREEHLSHAGLDDVKVVGCVKCRIERELSAVRVLQLLGKD